MTRALGVTVIAAALLAGCSDNAGVPAVGGGGGGGGSTVTLTRIDVAPATATRAVGTTQAFTVTGTYSDASTAPLATGLSWASSAPAVASISGSGVATALAAGITTITATHGSLSDTASLTVTALPPPPPPPPEPEVQVEITPERITLRNDFIERVWTRAGFATEKFTDRRSGRVWTEGSPDFSLDVGGDALLTSDLLDVTGEPEVETAEDGTTRVTLTLAPPVIGGLPFGFSVTRIIEMYPDVAGMRLETFVNSTLPLLVGGYSLDQAEPAGNGLTADIHSFRAGADWREPGWGGPEPPTEGFPPLVIGDAHPGTWRETSSGADVTDTAQWLSLRDDANRRLFYVLERNDYTSSMMSFSDGVAQALVDLGRDVLYLGPIEESGHAGNPTPLPVRPRAIVPGTPLRLEPVFTGLATDGDDEPWQHYKYLDRHRMPPYRREITFNSNGTDDNVISTGAKDDMNEATFLAVLPTARQMGIETFIFDDGWQARSGDWCPDSQSDDPACQEPRLADDPVKFAPRFSDPKFTAVKAALEGAGMQLGLWMSPMHFNPNAIAFQENPQWLCEPVGAALLALNLAEPESGSSDAGIVQWNPEAIGSDGETRLIDHIESRIRVAIEEWGVRYFKFDFTAWLDCAGAFPVDIYTYRESFMAMLDRVLADHPDTTIQMDETNDYRLFPFEAIARGPTWYQNGSPSPSEALHSNWQLAPFIPLYSLGRNALNPGYLSQYSVTYLMQVAMLSHITFFSDLRDARLTPAIPTIRTWNDYYKAHRADLATFVYPLEATNDAGTVADGDPVDPANWAAFQAWDADAARGALLVYRQDSGSATRKVSLRNVPDGTYRLHLAPAEAVFDTFTAAQLRAGITVTLPAVRTAKVWRIERVGGPAP